MPDPGKSIAGWAPPPFRFGGRGMAPTVAHSDLVTSSLAGPGVATTAARSDAITASLAGPGVAATPARSDILTAAGVPTMLPVAGGVLIQSNSTVGTTNGSGDLSVVFAVAFPTSCDSVIVCNGDATVNSLLIFSTFVRSVTGFSVTTRVSSSGAVFASTAVRLDWVAFGH